MGILFLLEKKIYFPYFEYFELPKQTEVSD